MWVNRFVFVFLLHFISEEHKCMGAEWQILNDEIDSESELEQASTHKSAKTHAGNVFMTLDLDFLTPK